MDLTPTVCEAAGVAPTEKLNGFSIVASMTNGEHKIPPRDLLWVRRDGGARCQAQDYYAYRSGDWKILQNHPFEPLRLYNLQDDPGEKNDLSEHEPKRRKELISRLMLHIQEAGQVPWQRPSPLHWQPVNFSQCLMLRPLFLWAPSCPICALVMCRIYVGVRRRNARSPCLDKVRLVSALNQAYRARLSYRSS